MSDFELESEYLLDVENNLQQIIDKNNSKIQIHEEEYKKDYSDYVDKSTDPEIRKFLSGHLKQLASSIDYLNDDTVAETIKQIKPDIFAKGGDRNISNLPQREIEICESNNIQIVTNLGKKINSSSKLVERLSDIEKDNCKVDLHIHTMYSDGGLSVQELFDNLKKNNIKIASITDHNNFDAYKELPNINTYGINIIEGMEVDVEYKGSILHLLMYNFDKNSEKMQNYCKKIRKNDIFVFERMINDVCKLYNLNIKKEKILDFEKRNQYFDKVKLNNFLVELGFAESPKDAFYNFTKDVEDKKRLAISAQEFFDLAKDSHAITSIAHPMKYLEYYDSIKNIEKMILELKNLGLDSVEVFNNRQTIDDEMEIYRFAVENNLAISGGSDYHAKLGSEEKKELGKALDKTLCKKMITIIK